jgi:hypothetical protein
MPAKKRETFPIMLLIMEIVFVLAFLAFLFFKVLAIEVQPLAVQFSGEGFDYFILLVLAGLAGLFHFWLARRYPKIAAMEGQVTALYKERAKAKVSKARDDSRVVAALALEMIMVIVIAFVLYALVDQEISIIKSDIPWLGKAVALLVIAGLAFYGYVRFTKPFFKSGAYYETKVEKPEKKAKKKVTARKGK